MMNKRLPNGLGILQVFIGLGAVAGGLGLVLDPSGASMRMPIEFLKDSPFSTFLVPGVVLLTVNGLGSLAGAAASFRRHPRAGEVAMVLRVFLVAWIIVQVYWISAFHWLHALYICLGLLEFGLGWSLRKVP